MDLAPLQTFLYDEYHKSAYESHGHKNKCNHIKDPCSNRSCNAPKQLRTKQYHRYANQKIPPELLGKASASTVELMEISPTKTTP